MSVQFHSYTYAESGEIIHRGPMVDLNQRNAAEILRLLGLLAPLEAGQDDPAVLGVPVPDGEMWGECDPQDFLGRVMLAEGLLDIATDDARGLPGWRDGNRIQLPRAAGHLAMRLRELADLAQDALHNRGKVIWW